MALLCLSAIAQSTGSASHNGLMRVENEYKLHVPDTLADALDLARRRVRAGALRAAGT